MGFYCTSFITAVDTGEKISVTIGKEHYGHDTEIEHLRISQEDRTSIASKLQAGITLQRILDDVRNDFDGTNFKRLHMLTRKDLNNIQRDFRLINIEATTVNEIDSVKMWVNSKSGLDYDLILHFKQQGETDDTKYFKDADFFLAIMTKAQKALLSRFGSDVVCVDSTHGTNSSNFFLITLLILEEFRCGFPVAFCLSNRQDEHTLRMWLTSFCGSC